MDISTMIFNFIDIISLLFFSNSCDNSFSLQQDRIFDFIVVGAGSAGAVVASRLSENPAVKVLLLEAGGCQPFTGYVPATAIFMLNTNVDWGYRTVPQTNCFLSYPNRQPVYHQGKMFGGSSSINAMMYIRGIPENFNNWEAMGNPGWGWDTVLPYYLKAEANTIPSQASNAAYHNTKGPLFVSNAPYQSPILTTFLLSGVQNGYATQDINGANQAGFAATPFTMWNGERWSTYSAYLKSTTNRSNLVKVSNAYVTKVLLSNGQAVGVEVNWKNSIQTFYASREVILSAGAISSPKILQLSGIGDPVELAKHNIQVQVPLQGVGKNFHDHVGCIAPIWKVNCADCTYSVQKAQSLSSIIQYAFQRNSPASVPYGVEGVGFIHTKYATPGIPDVELQFVTANMADNVPVMTSLLGIDGNILQQYYQAFSGGSSTVTIFFDNLYPQSRGTLTLSSSDPYAPPNIDFAYLTVQQDALVLVEGLKNILQIMNSTAMRNLGVQFNPTIYPGCESYLLNSDAYYECYVRQSTWTSWHAAGSCKMGNSNDPMAVVDAQLRVYNVPRLRVIDASIMPQLIAGNSNAATIMIGEKGADMIKQQYGI